MMSDHASGAAQGIMGALATKDGSRNGNFDATNNFDVNDPGARSHDNNAMKVGATHQVLTMEALARPRTAGSPIWHFKGLRTAASCPMQSCETMHKVNTVF